MGYKLKRAYIGTQQVRPSWWRPWANTLLYLPMKSDLDDHSGNNITMTNNWVVIENWFWKFNWTSSYIYTTNNFSLASTPFTVSFWMNADSVANKWLISQNRYTGGYKWWNIFIVNQKVRTELTPSWWQQSTWTITTGTWYNIVMTVPASWNRVVYRNWTQEATWSNSVTFTSIPVYIWTSAWTAADISSTGMKYEGYMSDIIIEDKAWTQQEVSDYYNLTKWSYWIS